MRRRPAVVSAFVALIALVLLPAISNVEANALPVQWAPYLWIAWPVGLVLAAPLVYLEIRQWHQGPLPGSERGAASADDERREIAASLQMEKTRPAAMFSMRGDIPNFVGRREELRVLLDSMAAAAAGPADGIVVHTVDGMAGVGKTTFSVHAAHYLADRFPDGQIFLDLYGNSPTQPPRDPADALASLLVATGLDRSALPDKVDDRARLWRDRIAGKKVLLVLDDAASHDQLQALLPGTPNSFVLITSRNRLLGLDAVHALSLEVLPPGQAVHLLLTCAHREPATAATTEPATTDAAASEQDAAARVVQLCGHLPLAISLAAGRLRGHATWSLSYLADLLAVAPDRLEHLTAGSRSIQAAFAVSYQHLTVQRQRVFALLGVHPGPSIDVYALAALASCPLIEADQHLEALHADHLIQETTPGRYQLHDLLRDYAGSLAAADQTRTEQAMHRVLDYYLYTAATADAQMPVWAAPTLAITLHTPTHHPDVDTPQRARAWLDTELATLVRCLDHAFAPPGLVVALSAVLHNYLRVSGAWDHALRIHRTALAAAERTHDRGGQATALANLGRVSYLRGDWLRAQQIYAQAHQLFSTLGSVRGQATTLSDLGRVCLLPGEYERALEVFHRALRLFTDVGDRRGQANTLVGLGRAYYLQGDYGRAQEALDQAFQLVTDLGDHRGQANAGTFLGHLYYLRGDYKRAQHLINQSHHLWIDIGSQRGQALNLADLGRVCHQEGEYDRALDLLRRAHALFAAIGDPDHIETLNSLGDLALDHPPAGDPHALFSQAHTLARAIGTAQYEAQALAGLGRCAHRTHDIPTATTTFTEALTIYKRLGSPEAATITGYLADLRDSSDQHAKPQ